MARTIRNAKLTTRSARAKLPMRREPYWTVISEGCALGYRRGDRGGTWIGKFRDENKRRHYEALGASDDARDPDGLSVFSFAQAQERAHEFFRHKAREAAGDMAPHEGPYTIASAFADYLRAYERRGGKALYTTRLAANTHILPAIGALPVRKLTARRIEGSRHGTMTFPSNGRACGPSRGNSRNTERATRAVRVRESAERRPIECLRY